MPFTSWIRNLIFPDLASTADLQKGDALIGFKQPLANAVPRTVHDKLTECLSVKDFGALGDGITDDTAAIRRAIAVAGEHGAALCVPPGNYKITGTLSIPANFRLLGAHAANCKLLIPTAAAYPVLEIIGRANVYISGLSVEFEDGPQARSVGLYIANGARDILIERCVFKGGWHPVLIAGVAGNPVEYVTLRDVEASHGPIGWGIELQHCENISLYNCIARWNALDGLKLFSKTFNVLVEGGHYDYNGSEHPEFGFSGDGIDVAQGGDRVTIHGCTCDHNVSSGITIKYVGGDANELGHVRNILISDVRCRGNGRLSNNGNGINGQGSGVPGETFYAHDIVIKGGLFEENASNGILCSLTHTVIDGVIAKNNRGAGIFLTYLTHHVTISNVRCIRNGIDENGEGKMGPSNIGIIGASHIKLLGCTCLGAEPVSLNAMTLEEQEAAVAALQIPGSEVGLTKWNLIVQNRVVPDQNIVNEVRDVEVQHFTGKYSQIPGQPSAGDRFGVYIGQGCHVLFHHQGAGDPSVIGAPGTRGSQYIQTDAPDGESPLWVKVSDKTSNLLDDQKADWVRVGIGP